MSAAERAELMATVLRLRAEQDWLQERLAATSALLTSISARLLEPRPDPKKRSQLRLAS